MKTIKQLTGKFDYVNSEITEDKFPLVERKHKGYKLFHFDRYISSEDVVKEMKKNGYAPANIYELLSWPDWKGKDWVISLGSVVKVDGRRRVPSLDGDDSGRSLYLSRWGVGWGSGCRFLAVRNSSQALESKSSDTLSLGDLETRVQELEQDMQKIKKFLII